MTAQERLEELGCWVRHGGSSAAVSGSKLFERLIEGGTGGTGGSGHGLPKAWLPYDSIRVGETARAVIDLDAGDQATVLACFVEPHANRALQASALKIKTAALTKRLANIYRRIDAWLTESARAQRRAATEAADQAERQAASTAWQADVRNRQAQATSRWQSRARAKADSAARDAAPRPASSPIDRAAK